MELPIAPVLPNGTPGCGIGSHFVHLLVSVLYLKTFDSSTLLLHQIYPPIINIFLPTTAQPGHPQTFGISWHCDQDSDFRSNMITDEVSFPTQPLYFSD